MPRKLRVEYAGAIYHAMNRGDRRELIFLDDKDRETFLVTLGEACAKTGWQVHALCVTNFFDCYELFSGRKNCQIGVARFLEVWLHSHRNVSVIPA